MARLLRLLLVVILGLVIIAGGANYLFGPHLAAMNVFNAYKAAYLAGDAEKVTELTASNEIQFWDEQRKLALSANPDTVKALDFKRRAAVLQLRMGVIDKHMALEELQGSDPQRLYSLTRDMTNHPKVLSQMNVMFAVPTGIHSARGYMRMSQLPAAFTGHHEILALAAGLYYNFQQGDDGRWLVDPTPMLDGSARANEQIAVMMEPTGNAYLTLNYNPTKDPTREAQLWEPLLKQ